MTPSNAPFSRAARRRAPVLVALAAATLLSSCGGGGGGDGTPTIPPFWSYGGVVAKDFNGDGFVDVAVAASWVDGPPPHAGYLLVYLSTRVGFQAPVQYRVAADPWGLAAGHFSGGTGWDLVAASPDAGGGGRTDQGELSLLSPDAGHPGAFLPALGVATGSYSEFAAIGDVNGDGRADLLADDAVLARTRLLVQDHDLATPIQPVTLGPGTASLEMTVADLDGDGRQDIVVAAWNDVVVLYQRVGGSYAAPVHLAAGVNVQDVAVADLDGDGRLDIVAVNNGDANSGSFANASVSVMLQQSPGRFTTTTIPVAGGASQVAIGDLDGGGLPDLAVVSLVYQSFTTPSQVSLLSQSAAVRGVFSSPVVHDGPMAATSIAIGDVDGDGRNDIVLNDGPSVMMQSATVRGQFAAARRLGT